MAIDRVDEPSKTANNTDVFVWALYVLNGADKPVDVEDIYLKVFEIAPLRFGWRTRPDLPNFKKTAKALQEVEAKSHVGLLQRTSANLRRLSPAGKTWVEQNRHTLEATYGVSVVEAPSNSELTKRVKSLTSNPVYSIWRSGAEISMTHLSVLLNCSKSSAQVVWENRLTDLEQLGSLTKDEEILRLAIDARKIYEGDK